MIRRLIPTLLLLLFLAPTAPAGASENVVLASLDVTRALAGALTQGTSIRVRSLVPDGYVMRGRDAYFKQHREDVFKAAAGAEAVLSVRSVWPGDTLYKWARRGNIRIVHIDAATPLDGYGAGVPLAEVEGVASPFVWNSPANLTRMAAIVADDLCSLFPNDAETVRENLKTLQGVLFRLRSRFEAEFLDLESVGLAAFTVDYTYLADEFGLDVLFYELAPESRWTEADVGRIAARLRLDGVRAVICPWPPDTMGARAIRDGGATPVVLSRFKLAGNADPVQTLVGWYEDNLSRLSRALKN